MESKSGVYQIKNNINGLRFIGSAVNLGICEAKHFHALKIGVHYNIQLQSEYRRYGVKAFTFEVIEIVVARKDLGTREKFHIQSVPLDKLYNQAPKYFVMGKKTVNKICLRTGKILQSYTSIKEAGSANGISPSGISRTIAGRNKSAGGYYWTYAE